MRSTWTHVLICALLIVVRTQALRSEKLKSERNAEVEDSSNQDALLDLDKELKDDLKSSNLSVLPPIFLFEYTNGTNATNDDKSKRTIDSHLGYGFQGNNLISGHYNYYFPAGKSGTTVSIEESISPFLPKTIVESENQYNGDRRENNFFNQKSNNAKNQQPPRYDQTQAFFPQRTKLQKSSANLGSYQETSTIPSTHLSPFSTVTQGLSAYNSLSTTPNMIFESTTPSSSQVNAENSTPESLANITPAAYRSKYRFGPYNTPRTTIPEIRDPNSQEDYYSQPDDDLTNYPKYSVENGVKYEHKIVWKYPDGRVSDTPPTSYVTHPKSSTPKTITSNFPTGRYKNKPTNFHSINTHIYNNPSQSIYSQTPAQFPKDDSELKNSNQFPPNDFSDSSYESVDIPSSQLPPHKVVYQNSFNMKPNMRHRFPSNSPHRNNQRISNYNSAKTARPVLKYAVNSPNPEYIGTTENPGKIGSEKFSPEAQNYINKMLASGKFHKNSYGHKIVDPQYNDLLKFNPSISQYIKNPSSILNAQPTFVQAGNSLIPVIILRVDGAPPVQQKATPNINLKALLQQYLTQYAQSLNEMNQDSSYDLGNDYYSRPQSSKGGNPISDLTELTQSLSQYSDDPDIANGFQQRFPQSNRYDRRHYQSSNYVPIVKQGHRFMEDEAKMIETVNRYTSQGRKPQKVKNVEIIDGPRYTNYHRS
ncbi:uncharacterized protein LOC127279382 [Leptopilina boulardi]|uniref:uncharacterized protein LOC127279382 n=1 Tax=Leptopilina boulardi TaxID=63433 RepID=UPI0021F5EBB6|nr:uncharacterized protein LOC127279382 [Leptopilina boulardi]